MSLRHRITLVQDGDCFDCGADESVLHAHARSGQRGIPVGCRGGGCGVCKVEVLEGAYASLPMSRAHVSEADEQSQRVLACRIRPRSALVLRLIGKLHKLAGRWSGRT